MRSLNWLRFKITSSFVIAGLGLIMIVRLLSSASFSSSVVLAVVMAAIFVVAGTWRGFIFLRMMRRVKT